MREAVDRQQRPIREIPTQAGDEVRAHQQALARSEAHRRWVGEDADDGACRGID
jgi:hypothetical protein